MSRTLTLTSALEEKRKVEAEASQLHAEAVKLREKFLGEGLDLSAKANRDQFDELDAAFKAADAKKQEAEELADVAHRLAEIDGAAGRSTPYGRRPTAVGDEPSNSRQLWSPGQLFTQSAGFQKALKEGVFESVEDTLSWASSRAFAPIEIMSRDQLRAVLSGQGFRSTEITGASATSAGPFIQNELMPGFVEYIRKTPRILNVVSKGTTNSDTVEYVTQSAPTNNTDGVPEGTAAGEAVIPFATATVAVEDYAQFIPVSNRAMQDEAQIQTIIENELLTMLFDNVEDDLASGGGSSNDVEGIYTAVSQAQALGGDNRADAIHKAITQIRTAGGVLMEPDYVGIHPNDYQELILDVDGNGAYLMGPPALASARTIWGVPFLVSTVFTDGTPLVGNFDRGARFWLRQGARVTAGLNSDDFTKRRISLLANIRFAFKTIRPTAFCEVTGF